MTRLIYCVCCLLVLAPSARATHPQILATPADRDAIKTKIEQSAWARAAYASLKSRVDPLVKKCKSDAQFMSSRLFMHWQTHYTTPLVENSKWIGGEGKAPVPTPRLGGARDWATEYTSPARLEDLKPFNDQDSKVWLLNKATGKEEWADPSQTGRMFETVNERILQSAADASFIYWLSGDEQYAAYASEVLWTYMNGFSYVNPPKLPPGDRSMSRIIGVTSFEVIHEDIATPLAVSYDFLHDYLQSHDRDVKVIQAGLKKFADRVTAGGGRDGNWNLNQARIISYAGLALEENAGYEDGKGRPYYVDVVLNANLPQQLGITTVIKTGFDAETAVWPEAPGYGFGSAKDLILIASLVGNGRAGQAVLADPILPRSILAQADLIYPNGWSIGLGDTNNTRLNTTALELLIAAARDQKNAELEARLTAALKREIDSGNYDRSGQSNLVALTKYVAELKPSSSSIASARTFFGKPLNVLMQRNPGVDGDHSFAAAMYGTEGGHIHANGLALELFGAGLVMGADPGRGSSYWQPDHSEYYLQPPAHNTVIVNGRSNYPTGRGKIAMKIDAVEPAPGAAPLIDNISFAQASFHYDEPKADQQRTLALIRISPTSGFYFEVFKSRTTGNGAVGAGEKSFHDYLYHNIGQSLAATDGAGGSLAFSQSQLLSSKNGLLKGYDYFKNERSIDFTGEIHGTFTVDLSKGPKRMMSLWMLGQKDRRVFTVDAPANRAAREALPAKFTEMPMPTLIVRQTGDAWQNPFIAVYEPYLENQGPTIQSIRPAKLDAADSGVAACVVEGNGYTAYLVQSDDPTNTHTIEGHRFQGVFSAVRIRDGKVVGRYPNVQEK